MTESIEQIKNDIASAFDSIDIDEAIVIIRKNELFAILNVTDSKGIQSHVFKAIAEMNADLLKAL